MTDASELRRGHAAMDAVTDAVTVAAATMRAAVFDRFGPPEVVRIETVPRPVPADDEVLVRVRAASVSIADHRLRSRDIPRGLSLVVAPVIGMLRPRKRILGMDLAGVIESVGANVTQWSPGDEVIALRGSRMGGHAEYATVRAAGVIARKPSSLSFEDAASLVFGGYTAASFLSVLAPAGIELGPGVEVLVNGASGACGTAAIQLAARAGARVTAVCSTANADLVRSLGADRVIDYAREDFAAGADHYDVIIECVGNAPFSRVGRVLKPGGALLLIISDLRGMLSARRNSRRSGRLITAGGADVGAGALRDLATAAEAGRYRPVVDRVFDFDDIVAAHRYVDTGRKRGNVILRIA